MGKGNERFPFHPTPSMMNGTTLPTSRVAVVTGAAQGIGEAIALHLADDGFDVAISGSTRKPERLDVVAKAIEAKGRRAIVVTGDVSVEADIVTLVERTVQELGSIDVVSISWMLLV